MPTQSPQHMMTAVNNSMQERTGKTLEDWVQIVLSSGLDPINQKSVRNWLKEKHAIPQNSQWAIADAAARAVGWIRPSLDQYVDQQYAGNKAHLRPIFDHVRTLAERLGDDVSVEGRGTYTPFVRKRQFAAVAATTRSRVDLGLRFRIPPNSPILSPTNGLGQSTHKVGLASVEDVTPEVETLLKIAYEQNG